MATYKTKCGTSCKLVLLELPGNLEPINFRVCRKVHHPTSPGCCAIEVSGEKKEPEILDIIKANLADDENAFLPADNTYNNIADGAPHANACLYGTFRQYFHFSLTFRALNPKVIIGKNGLVILLFKSELESSDDSSD